MVDDLVDDKFVKQGSEGYSNVDVRIGAMSGGVEAIEIGGKRSSLKTLPRL
jgi:hypothetical protein